MGRGLGAGRGEGEGEGEGRGEGEGDGEGRGEGEGEGRGEGEGEGEGSGVGAGLTSAASPPTAEVVSGCSRGAQGDRQVVGCDHKATVAGTDARPLVSGTSTRSQPQPPASVILLTCMRPVYILQVPTLSAVASMKA